MKVRSAFRFLPFFSLIIAVSLLTGLTSCDSAESLGPPSDLDLPPHASAHVPDITANIPGSSHGAPTGVKPGVDLLAQMATDSGYTELVAALAFVDGQLDAGLVDLFSSDTVQYTVFAPTNEAFQALYAAQSVPDITGLDPVLVLDVLLYHVTEGRRASNSVVPPTDKNDRKIETLLLLDEDSDEVAFFEVSHELEITAIGNMATITKPDQSASNGIIHEIDAVLMPL